MEKESMMQLEQELDALARYIQRVRQEIAAIDRPVDEDHGFDSMGDQMDAIVKATETATTTIMEAMESSESAVEQLREQLDDPEQIVLLDKITSSANNVYEACSFQDISGQRVSKIAKSVTYVEERVNKLIELLGVEQMSEIEVMVPAGYEKTEDEALLNGPQMEGEGLSQDDINKLFD
jgi:chemotaxis protein CheZ